MPADYQILMSDPAGASVLKVVDNFQILDYGRVVNGIGSLQFTLPDTWDSRLNLYAFDIFNRPDARLEVWRSIGMAPAYLDMETVFLLDQVERDLNERGERVIIVHASDANDLLRRRCIPYAAGSTQATKTAVAADDLQKTIVKDNLGSTATDANRNISINTVQANLTLGPTLSKTFAWRNEVIKTLQEIAQASANAGTYLAFDIVWVSPTQLEFRTYTQQRGVNRTQAALQSSLVLDPEQGNLANLALKLDYLPELNYVYVAGQGTGSARSTATAQDSARANLTPFSRREQVVDARMTSDATSLQNEANAAVRDGRPRKSFVGRLQQTPGAQYGIHYRFGDAITGNFVNYQANARLDAMHVRMEDGLETVDAMLRVDDLL